MQWWSSDNDNIILVFFCYLALQEIFPVIVRHLMLVKVFTFSEFDNLAVGCNAELSTYFLLTEAQWWGRHHAIAFIALPLLHHQVPPYNGVHDLLSLTVYCRPTFATGKNAIYTMERLSGLQHLWPGPLWNEPTRKESLFLCKSLKLCGGSVFHPVQASLAWINGVLFLLAPHPLVAAGTP